MQYGVANKGHSIEVGFCRSYVIQKIGNRCNRLHRMCLLCYALHLKVKAIKAKESKIGFFRSYVTCEDAEISASIEFSLQEIIILVVLPAKSITHK